MKAFVTGATGLLGNNLVRLLVEQGHEVTALVRSPEKAQRLLGDLDIKTIQGDMQNVEGFAHHLEGCDTLFHTAAYFREYYQPGDHWPMLEAINVTGTRKLLEAADARGVGKAVHVSSGGVIGKDEGQVSDETTAPGGLSLDNLYFRSKVETEKVIAEFLKTHAMPVTLILPGWMFGPGDAAPTAAGQLVQDYLNKKLPGILEGGSTIVDARDVAQGMIKAVDKGESGERYIIAGKLTKLEEVMTTLEQVSDVKAPRLRIPYPVALSLAWVSETVARLTGRTTLMSVSGIKTIANPHAISSAKAVNELGVGFRPLEATLRDTVNWYRNHT